MKTKIKFHGDKDTDFYDKETPNVDSNLTCLAVISLCSASKKDENYYSQLFLKECKSLEEKVITHFHDKLRNFSYSDGSDEE